MGDGPHVGFKQEQGEGDGSRLLPHQQCTLQGGDWRKEGRSLWRDHGYRLQVRQERQQAHRRQRTLYVHRRQCELGQHLPRLHRRLEQHVPLWQPRLERTPRLLQGWTLLLDVLPLGHVFRYARRVCRQRHPRKRYRPRGRARRRNAQHDQDLSQAVRQRP